MRAKDHKIQEDRSSSHPQNLEVEGKKVYQQEFFFVFVFKKDIYIIIQKSNLE